YDGQEVKDLYSLVAGVYENPVFVGIYVFSMLMIAFHLWHGFESAFQTLGLNHKKWTPIIKVVGRAYSVLIPLGFAIIPVWMHFK
ncbi:MAG: succinate dehydrogenase, partial [Bacteroidota bacterium]